MWRDSVCGPQSSPHLQQPSPLPLPEPGVAHLQRKRQAAQDFAVRTCWTGVGQDSGEPSVDTVKALGVCCVCCGRGVCRGTGPGLGLRRILWLPRAEESLTSPVRCLGTVPLQESPSPPGSPLPWRIGGRQGRRVASEHLGGVLGFSGQHRARAHPLAQMAEPAEVWEGIHG